MVVPKREKVLSIEDNGESIDVYDIVAADPYRNFIANGVVVHNCGKTPQAIAFLNEVNPKSVLIVCPATLKLNWKIELSRWLALPLSVGIASKEFPNTKIVIINYDILTKHRTDIRSEQWDVVVLDEAHYLKNPDAKRTKEICGSIGFKPLDAKYKIALSGTPIVNRPIELFCVLKWLLPEGFPNRHAFAQRYCAASQTFFGWDYSGASNLDELQKRLRSTIMVRRLKQDVLTELPPKRRQIIEIDSEKKTLSVLKLEQSFIERAKAALGISKKEGLSEKDFNAVVNVLKNGKTIPFDEMTKARVEMGLQKLPFVIEHIKNVLEDVAKIVVFGVHKEVIKSICESFESFGVVSITGETPLAKRQEAVDRFQKDPKCRVFVGNIQAAGVGLTLTASSHVIFAELDWTPGNITQAEDRCHRIGQNESVLVQHLVLSGSLDSYMAKLIVRKQETIEKALNEKFSVELEALLK